MDAVYVADRAHADATPDRSWEIYDSWESWSRDCSRRLGATSSNCAARCCRLFASVDAARAWARQDAESDAIPATTDGESAKSGDADCLLWVVFVSSGDARHAVVSVSCGKIMDFVQAVMRPKCGNAWVMYYDRAINVLRASADLHEFMDDCGEILMNALVST